MILQDEALLKRVETTIWILLAGSSLAGLALFKARFGLGILVGGILAIGNFYLMKRSLHRALDPSCQKGARFFYLVKYCLRLAALAVIIAILLITGWVDPFGLLLGLSIIVVSIVLVGFNEARKLIFKGVV